MRMIKLFAPLAVAAFAGLALVASPARADITDVSKDRATVGSEIVITGSGFGTRKPRVRLIGADPEKRRRPNRVVVLSGSDDQLTVRIAGAREGTYRFEVKPRGRGAAAMTSPGTLDIVPPEIVSVDPASANAGDTVDVTVNYAVSRVRVCIGGRRAPVLAVNDIGNATVDTSVVSVRMPGRSAGHWNVEVKTPVGSGTAKAAVEVVGASPPVSRRPRLTYQIDGGRPVRVPPRQIGVVIGDEAFSVGGGTRRRRTERVITIRAPIGPEDDPGGAAFGAEDGALIAYQETGPQGKSVWSSSADEPFAVIVNYADDDVVVFTFCGTLSLVSLDGGAATVEVEGECAVKREETTGGGGLGGLPDHQLECRIRSPEHRFEGEGALTTAELTVLPQVGPVLSISSQDENGFRVSFSVPYDPRSDGSAVFDSVTMQGEGPNFTYIDGLLWQDFVLNPTSPTFPKDKSVTISIQSRAGNVVEGSFSGQIQRADDPEVKRAVELGSFRIAWTLTVF